MDDGVKVFLDSGAFSYYNKWGKARSTAKKDTVMGRGLRHARLSSVAYTRDPGYLRYRADYVRFVREHAATLECYANLDVVGDAELTYSNQVWLEDQGLEPLPVWHLGSDTRYLRRYLEEGYTYLCLGGMVGTPKASLLPALDRLWAEHLTDDAGLPLAKVHGFGMTMVQVMRRYPWYSVDSNSWCDYGYRGRLLLPRFRGNGEDFRRPWVLYVTERRKNAHPHLSELPRGLRLCVEGYLSSIGAALGRSTIHGGVFTTHKLREDELWVRKPTPALFGVLERRVERGVVNDFQARDEVNLRTFLGVEATMPGWPWPLPRGIKKGRGLL